MGLEWEADLFPWKGKTLIIFAGFLTGAVAPSPGGTTVPAPPRRVLSPTKGEETAAGARPPSRRFPSLLCSLGARPPFSARQFLKYNCHIRPFLRSLQLEGSGLECKALGTGELPAVLRAGPAPLHPF